MAKKHGRTTGKKNATTVAGKARGRSAPASAGRVAKSTPAAKFTPAPRPKVVAAAPERARPAASRPTAPPEPVAAPLLDRATRLFDDIQRSKVTHPDPWGYTTKARSWSERAERLVTDATAGRDVRGALDGLA